MLGGVEQLSDLFKDDRILCDSEMNLYSLNPDLQRTASNESPFELCSDRMQRLYPTYALHEDGVFLVGPETQTISFSELRSLLLSKDRDGYDRLIDLTSQCKFLDGMQDLTGDRIAM